MRYTLAEIATLIDGELLGDGTRVIEQVAPIDEAGPTALAFLLNAKYGVHLKHTRAGAVVVPISVRQASVPLIRVTSPEKALITVLATCFPVTPPVESGIHPTAVIGENVTLGPHAAVGPFVTIGRGTTLEEGVRIGAGSIIGSHCHIGSNTWLYPRVTLYDRVCLGASVVVHSGVVIGSDGFGYVRDGRVAVKIPQIGVVRIGDEVEIGANTTIDRATLGATRIGHRTKIDNLVQIGHNVVIGDDVTICAQVGIAGSTTIKDGTVIAGQAGLADHITVGEAVKIGGQAGVTKSVPPHTAVSGYPARPHQDARRIEAHVGRLPELARQVQAMQRRLEELEQRLKNP